MSMWEIFKWGKKDKADKKDKKDKKDKRKGGAPDASEVMLGPDGSDSEANEAAGAISEAHEDAYSETSFSDTPTTETSVDPVVVSVNREERDFKGESAAESLETDTDAVAINNDAVAIDTDAVAIVPPIAPSDTPSGIAFDGNGAADGRSSSDHQATDRVDADVNYRTAKGRAANDPTEAVHDTNERAADDLPADGASVYDEQQKNSKNGAKTAFKPARPDTETLPEPTAESISGAEPEAPQKEQKKKGLFAKLKEGLKKTRDSLLGSLFVENGEKIDDDFYDELEEAMIISDMGMATTEKLLSQLRSALKSDGIRTRTEAKQVMIRLLADCMRPDDNFLENTKKSVILVVGVNGVGKTTSIGKLAAMYKAEGRSVMLAAGDTFRAAAAEQLTIWAERAGVPIVKHGEGADPAAVVFDSIASFKAKKCDMLICDTAGRLHNKKNLMSELSKIRRVIDRELPDVPVEVLLVLDATTGQNAIAQAKVFGENTGLTGIILTKLDGTAKGGVVVAVKDELGLPVRYVGVGEGIDDLQPFDADAFANALL